MEVVVYYILEMTLKKSTLKGTDNSNKLLSTNKLAEDDKNTNILKEIDYSSIQDIIPKTGLVKIDSTHKDPLKSFFDKYLESKQTYPSSSLTKNKNELPMLLTSGEKLQEVNHFNSSSVANDNNNSNRMPIKPPSSPLFTHYSNMSLSPMKYSPRVRKSSIDSAISMQIEDELFKNTAIRKIISNTMHSNQNLLLNKELFANNDDDVNNNPSFNDSIMNSIHSRNIFDLDFNFEDSDQNGIHLDKKTVKRSFFEYDNLSS